MHSSYADYQDGDIHSQTHRSRTNSGVSTTEGLFQSLKLVESPANTFDTASYPSSRPPSSQRLSTPYISSGLPTSPAFLPASSSHLQLSLPPTSDSLLDSDWFNTPHATTLGAPFFRIEPASSYSGPRTTSSPSPRTTQSASMRCVPTHSPSWNHIWLTCAPVLLPSSTIPPSTWPADPTSPGLLWKVPTCLVTNSTLTHRMLA